MIETLILIGELMELDALNRITNALLETDPYLRIPKMVRRSTQKAQRKYQRLLVPGLISRLSATGSASNYWILGVLTTLLHAGGGGGADWLCFS